MEALVFFLCGIGFALFVEGLLLVAIGNPKLKHHLDAQTEAHDTDRNG